MLVQGHLLKPSCLRVGLIQLAHLVPWPDWLGIFLCCGSVASRIAMKGYEVTHVSLADSFIFPVQASFIRQQSVKDVVMMQWFVGIRWQTDSGLADRNIFFFNSCSPWASSASCFNSLRLSCIITERVAALMNRCDHLSSAASPCVYKNSVCVSNMICAQRGLV